MSIDKYKFIKREKVYSLYHEGIKWVFNNNIKKQQYKFIFNI